MNIPTSFQLGPFTYSIHWAPALQMDNNHVGQYHDGAQKVYLAPVPEGTTTWSEASIEATFYHELVHAILFRMKRDDLNKDEAFVDQFAEFLYQFVLTKTGNLQHP